MRSRRPWCFSHPTTAATSRERSCLWMVASHKFRRARHQGSFLRFALPCAVSLELTGKNAPNERGFLMRQLQLIAHGEPSDVIELNTGFEPVLGQEEVLVSMEAAPINPSDFTLVRGIYGVRPALPFSLGSEGVGRVVKTGSKVDVALQGMRVLILTRAGHVGRPGRRPGPQHRANETRSRSAATLD